MKATVCIAVIATLLLVGTSAIAQGSWEAQLRVIPESLGLKVRLLYEGQDRPMGRLLDLQFELWNVIDEAITIDWDESSLQLPGDQQWYVVRPEVLFEADESTMIMLAGSRKALRVCPVLPPSAVCDSRWLQRARLNEDFSLTLRLAVSTSQGPRTGEWRWDFDYHEEAVPDDPPPPDRSLSFIVLAAAVVILALLLLR